MDIYEFFEEIEADFGYVPQECLEGMSVYKTPADVLKGYILRDFTGYLNCPKQKDFYPQIRNVIERVKQF